MPTPNIPILILIIIKNVSLPHLTSPPHPAYLSVSIRIQCAPTASPVHLVQRTTSIHQSVTVDERNDDTVPYANDLDDVTRWFSCGA